MDHVSLVELNQLISKTLKEGLDPTYWIIAEIGEMRVNQKGHCYMEMIQKEDEEIKAKIRANIWSFTFRNLSGWFAKISGKELQPGLNILFNASAQFHPVYGLSLNIKDIDAQYTLGERVRMRQEVLDKLNKDGVLEMNKEIELPQIPQNIAVISSPTAAGYGDFINHLEKNRFGYKISCHLFNAMMQGEEAPASIIRAFHSVFESLEQYDLLVILRGGGASVDLDCFDNYELASHIAQFPIPVITGIGHDRDETVADLVAHTSLKTPTAVAEFIITGIEAFEELIDGHFNSINSKAKELIGDSLLKINEFAHSIQLLGGRILHGHSSKVNTLDQSLRFRIKSNVDLNDLHLERLSEIIRSIPSQILTDQLYKINNTQKTILLLDPQKILDRGYTLSTVRNSLLKNVTVIDENSKMITIAANKKVVSRIIKNDD